MTSLVQKISSGIAKKISSISPFTVIRRNELAVFVEEYENMQEAYTSMSGSNNRWISAAEVNTSTNAIWLKIFRKSMAGYAADGVIKRISDLYTEWGTAGGIRYDTKANAGWASATLNRLWPKGLFPFFEEVIFYFVVFGEMYFLPVFDPIRRLISYELISPLEVIEVRKDAPSNKIFFKRRWLEETVTKTANGEDLEYNQNYRDKAYSSDEVLVVKWNCPGNRGLPFVHPIIHWVQIYNEWLKDRANTNRMRTFAYLKRKLNAHPGVAKMKADQWPSQMMKTTSYVPGRTDQYGFGFKVEKMPTGGILTEDENTEWDVLNFDIQGDDASPDGHAFRQQVCALTAIPEALLFSDDKSKLDTADSRVESLVRKIEFIREMFTFILNGVLQHCRNAELVSSNNLQVSLAGRRVDTQVHLKFKPAAVGERRFVTEDLNKAMIGGQISQQTAREISPFVIDPDEELQRIESEHKSELVTSFLDRIGAAKSNRDDGNADNKKKSKDADAGTRGQEYDTKNKGAGER